MKIAVNYFTYSGDTDMVADSIRALKGIALPDDCTVDIFMVDDAASPIGSAPDGVEYIQTTFQRNGHLAGPKCVLGMMECYRDELAKKDYDWIVKVDSDTVINSFDWLKDCDKNRVGLVGSRGDYPHVLGCLYALSRAGVEHVLSKFADEAIAERLSTSELWEDDLVTRIMSMSETLELCLVYGDGAVFKPFSFGGDSVRMFETGDFDVTAVRKHPGVNFKPSFAELDRATEVFATVKAKAAENMKWYVDEILKEEQA